MLAVFPVELLTVLEVGFPLGCRFLDDFFVSLTFSSDLFLTFVLVGSVGGFLLVLFFADMFFLASGMGGHCGVVSSQIRILFICVGLGKKTFESFKNQARPHPSLPSAPKNMVGKNQSIKLPE